MPNNEGGKAQRDYRTVLYVGCFFVGGGGGGVLIEKQAYMLSKNQNGENY